VQENKLSHEDINFLAMHVISTPQMTVAFEKQSSSITLHQKQNWLIIVIYLEYHSLLISEEFPINCIQFCYIFWQSTVTQLHVLCLPLDCQV